MLFGFRLNDPYTKRTSASKADGRCPIYSLGLVLWYFSGPVMTRGRFHMGDGIE
jgi:hypothetical protein